VIGSRNCASSAFNSLGFCWCYSSSSSVNFLVNPTSTCWISKSKRRRKPRILLELQKKSDWDVQEVLSSESSEISGETGRSKKDSLVNKMKARFYQSAKNWWDFRSSRSESDQPSSVCWTPGLSNTC
jgi:hypothetical protein